MCLSPWSFSAVCRLLTGNTHLTSKEPLHGHHNERVSLYESGNAAVTVPFHILQRPVICKYVCCKGCVKSILESAMTKFSEKEFGKFVFCMQMNVFYFGAFASEHKEGFVNSFMLKQHFL